MYLYIGSVEKYYKDIYCHRFYVTRNRKGKVIFLFRHIVKTGNDNYISGQWLSSGIR